MSTFDYRRKLDRDDWMKIAGIAGGAGLAVAGVVTYFARLWFQKVPLERADTLDTLDERRQRVLRSVEAQETLLSE